MRKALDLLYLLTGWLAGAFLLAIFALMMVMSIGRQLDLSLPSGDEFVAWCMAATAFLGLAYTFRSGDMVRVELLYERFEGRARTVVEVLCLMVAGLVIGWFTISAFRMTLDSWRLGDMAQGVLKVPLWIPQIGYLTGLAVLAIAIADELVRVISGFRPTYAKEAPQTAEEVIERAMQSGV